MSNLLALKCNLFQLYNYQAQNCISYSLSRKLLSLILFILALCFQNDFFLIVYSLFFSFYLLDSKLLLLFLISGIDLDALTFSMTPLMKFPVIFTPVFGQNSQPYPFFSPLSNIPQQTQSSLVSLPSPWYSPFSKYPIYFSVGFSMQNLPVLCPSLNQPFIFEFSLKFISTPSPCLNPLQNSPKYIFPSQKYKNPSQVRSFSIQNPKQMQFLYFLIWGDLMTIPHAMIKLAKNEKIQEGVDFQEICFSFLQYSITTSSLTSFIFLVYSLGVYFYQILKLCLTICPTLVLFRGATTELTNELFSIQY